MSKCALCGGQVVRSSKQVWCNVEQKYVTVIVFKCIECGKEG